MLELLRLESLGGWQEGHLLLSAGWDSTVRLWDLRSGQTVQTLPSHHVCGDSLDVHGHEVLIGTYSTKRLALFDMRTASPISPLPWEQPGCKLCAREHACTPPSPLALVRQSADAHAGVGPLVISHQSLAAASLSSRHLPSVFGRCLAELSSSPISLWPLPR